MKRGALLAVVALAACGRDAPRGESSGSGPGPAVPAGPRAPGASLTPARRAEAEALVVRFECLRCHAGPALAEVPFEKHCVTCHRELRDGTARLEAPAEDLVLWRSHVKSLLVVPSLFAAGARLRRDWIAGFLLHPVDVRPGLPAMMPRLALTAAEAALLAEYLVPDEVLALELAGADAARGRGLFRSHACGGCHAMTGEPAVAGAATPDGPSDAQRLAPDLGRVAARFQPGRLVRWLQDPSSLVAGSLMPATGLTDGEARDVAAFLLETPAPPAPPPPLMEARLPVLTRPVEFAEVSERVLRKVCWHCHSAPYYAEGDGGPGNTGGFGFAGRGLDLSSHTGVLSGAIGDDGRRRGILSPTADGTPYLVALLMARRLEERGGEVPGLRGMPLGLTAMSLEDVQVVESWIAQGRPE